MLSTARRAVGSTALRFLPYSLILLTFADLRAGRHELLLRPTRVLLPTLLTFGCGRAGRRRRRRLLLSQRHGRTDAQCTKRSENFHHLMSPEVAPPAPTRQRACMATVPPIPPADGAIAMLQKKCSDDSRRSSSRFISPSLEPAELSAVDRQLIEPTLLAAPRPRPCRREKKRRHHKPYPFVSAQESPGDCPAGSAVALGAIENELLPSAIPETYFRALIRARPLSGSFALHRCAGDSVTITSSVGRT